MSIPLLPLREVTTRLSSSWHQSFQSLKAIPSPTTRPRAYTHRIGAILFFFLPSFIQTWLRPSSAKPRRLYPTSWLDGLRGVAAFIVFLWHFIGDRFGSWYWWPYGLHDPNDHAQSSPLQLPFIRTLWAGHTMVHVFFVISGYVLCYKPLKYLRKRDHDGLFLTLSSSVFRRGLRLYLPIIALTLIISILVFLGGPFTLLPIKRRLTLLEQLWAWLIDCIRLRVLPYEKNLWTIPIEFHNSLLLFIVLVGLGRLETYLRLTFLFAIMAYYLGCGQWMAFEFLAGFGLAEVGFVQNERRERASALAAEVVEEGGDEEECLESKMKSSSRSAVTHLIDMFFFGNLLFGLFAAGWPLAATDKAPGYSALYFSTLVPMLSSAESKNFWMALSATQIVAATQHFQVLQDIFVSPLAQYLGDISYSLYLVHGSTMLLTVPHYLPSLWAWFGGMEQVGMGGRMSVWFIGTTVAAIPTVWAADIFLRVVDRRSVKLARWIETLCVHQAGGEPL